MKEKTNNFVFERSIFLLDFFDLLDLLLQKTNQVLTRQRIQLKSEN